MMWDGLYNAPGGLGGAIWGYVDEVFALPQPKVGTAFWKEFARTANLKIIKETVSDTENGELQMYGDVRNRNFGLPRKRIHLCVYWQMTIFLLLPDNH